VKTWVKNKIPVNEDLILEAQQTRCDPWLGVTPLEIKGGPVEVNHTHTAVEMAHKYAMEHGKEEITLPEKFKHHIALFSDKEANKFPPTWGEGDHKIVLMDTTPTHFNCKVYPLSRDEQKAEDQFINENLAKGYITPSDSPYSFSMFMVPKKDSKEKWYIIDYCPLNVVTRKDVTPLPNRWAFLAVLYVKCHAPKEDMSSSSVSLIDSCQTFVLRQIKRSWNK